MIYGKLIEESNIKSVDLEKLINDGYIYIIFKEEIIDEFNLQAKEGSIGISVRNRYLDGRSGKPIEHDPTIKVSITKSGLPITIGHDPHLHKNSDTASNRRKIAPYIPAIKKFIFENRKDLVKYWYTDPNTDKGKKQLEKLERIIKTKYIKEGNKNDKK